MLFEACKGISAANVAQQAGIALQQRGGRQWACCPLHGERTPSLMFDAEGNWHCFGCGRGGDAVALYAALYGLPQLEAARALAQSNGVLESIQWITPADPPAKRLKDRVDAWYKKEWGRWCRVLHTANALIDSACIARDKANAEAKNYTLPSAFYNWVDARSAAENRLDMLMLASVRELVEMMLEEHDV